MSRDQREGQPLAPGDEEVWNGKRSTKEARGREQFGRMFRVQEESGRAFAVQQQTLASLSCVLQCP